MLAWQMNVNICIYSVDCQTIFEQTIAEHFITGGET